MNVSVADVRRFTRADKAVCEPFICLTPSARKRRGRGQSTLERPRQQSTVNSRLRDQPLATTSVWADECRQRHEAQDVTPSFRVPRFEHDGVTRRSSQPGSNPSHDRCQPFVSRWLRADRPSKSTTYTCPRGPRAIAGSQQSTALGRRCSCVPGRRQSVEVCPTGSVEAWAHDQGRCDVTDRSGRKRHQLLTLLLPVRT